MILTIWRWLVAFWAKLQGNGGTVTPQDVEPETPGEKRIFFAFLGLMVWAPLPYGSNRLWSLSLLELGIFSLLAVWFYLRINHPTPLAGLVKENTLPWIFFSLWILYPLFQLIPFPREVLNLLSPSTVAIVEFSGGSSDWHPITLDVFATFSTWMKGITYLGGFWLTLVLARSRDRLLQLALVFIISGSFQSIFALMTASDHPKKWVVGTFVNPNHLAGFLELCIPVGFGLLIGWMERKSTRHLSTWRHRMEGWLQVIGGRKGVISAVIVVMMLALFLTRSRSGAAIMVGCLILVSWLASFRKYKSNREKWLLIPFIISSVLVGAWYGLGHLVGRFLSEDIQSQDRWQIAEVSFSKIKDFLWFGSGSGTFSSTFPVYQTSSLKGAYYDHAHNDHLEILADQGVIGYALLILAMSACWLPIIKNYLRRRDPFGRGLLFASLVGSLALVLHGLLDFNFQIPVNALYFMVMLAMGLQAGYLVSPLRDQGAKRMPSENSSIGADSPRRRRRSSNRVG